MKTRVTAVLPLDDDPMVFHVRLACGHELRAPARDVDMGKMHRGHTVDCFRCDRPELQAAVAVLDVAAHSVGLDAPGADLILATLENAMVYLYTGKITGARGAAHLMIPWRELAMFHEVGCDCADCTERSRS